MKSIDFLNKFIDPKIPALARTIAQLAVNELNKGDFKPIEVTELEFNMVCKYADYQPIKPALGTDFIRIFDSLDNSKDIQIHNPCKR